MQRCPGRLYPDLERFIRLLKLIGGNTWLVGNVRGLPEVNIWLFIVFVHTFAITKTGLSCSNLKSRAKYNFALFVLLLVGYTQVFAPMYTAMVSQDTDHDYVQVPFLKAADIEGLEIEDETKKSSVKVSLINADFVYCHLLQQFAQDLKNHASFVGYSSCISLLASPDPGFDVLRL